MLFGNNGLHPHVPWVSVPDNTGGHNTPIVAPDKDVLVALESGGGGRTGFAGGRPLTKSSVLMQQSSPTFFSRRVAMETCLTSAVFLPEETSALQPSGRQKAQV